LLAIFKIVLLTGQWDNGDTPLFWLLWIVAAASMTVGNVLALRQTNIKRLLAYSGIAHAGYMLVGLLAGPQAGKAVATGGVSIFGDGSAAVLYYVVIYGIANLGAFAVLGVLRAGDKPCETLRDVAGLLRRHPGPALLLALAMFTLMGLPPTPGFWGKLSLFGSALASARVSLVEGHSTWLIALVVIAVLNTAVAAAYYLRVIAAVLLYENDRPAHVAPREMQQIGALMCGFLLLIFAFYPTWLMTAGAAATSELNERIESVSASAARLPDGPSEEQDDALLDLFGLAPQDATGFVEVDRPAVEKAVDVTPLPIEEPLGGGLEPRGVALHDNGHEVE
jgi:NADH-quinone oxidoreductase subunit N